MAKNANTEIAIALPDSWNEFYQAHGAPEPREVRSIENPATPISAELLDVWGGTPTTAGVRVNEVNALKLAVLWACVRVLQETMAALPWHVYEEVDGAKKIARAHPLYDVLHTSPNSLMTSFTFREVMLANCLLFGRFYALIMRAPDGRARLITVPPWMVRQVWTPQGLRYEVRAGDSVASYEPEDMIHIPGMSLDGVTSLSPVMVAAREAIGLGLAIEEHNSRFFSNGARLGGVLTTDGVLDEAARLRIKQAWASTQGGTGNAYKTAVLEAGLKWQQVAQQSDHAQLDSTRRFQVEEVCRVFRMPPSFVQDHTRSTFSNVEQQDLHFAKHTILPWCVRIEQEFDRKLFAGTGFYCKFNLDGLMRGDFKSRIEGLARGVQSGLYTPNEARGLLDLPAREGGDQLFLQQNMAAASVIAKNDPTDDGGTPPAPAPKDDNDTQE